MVPRIAADVKVTVWYIFGEPMCDFGPHAVLGLAGGLRRWFSVGKDDSPRSGLGPAEGGSGFQLSGKSPPQPPLCKSGGATGQLLHRMRVARRTGSPNTYTVWERPPSLPPQGGGKRSRKANLWVPVYARDHHRGPEINRNSCRC